MMLKYAKCHSTKQGQYNKLKCTRNRPERIGFDLRINEEKYSWYIVPGFYSLEYNKGNGVAPNLFRTSNFYVLPVASNFC